VCEFNSVLLFQKKEQSNSSRERMQEMDDYINLRSLSFHFLEVEIQNNQLASRVATNLIHKRNVNLPRPEKRRVT